MDYFAQPDTLPQIGNVRTAARTAVFEVQSVDLRFSNGATRTYERLTPARKPAVMVAAVREGCLMMIREYAVGTERYELTLPKGLIDPGETPEQAACRELQEETGFAARRLDYLRLLYSNPGHMYGPMHLFAAADVYEAPLQGDEPEPLQTVPVPLADLEMLTADPRMGDARVLSALFLLQKHFQAA